MGLRGPAPKPTMLKLAAGNPGRRPLPTDEVIPPAGQPDMPAWLSERAKVIWANIVPRLSQIGLARAIDGGALARYCTLYVLFIDADAFIQKHGPTYPVRAEGINGKPGRIKYVREWPQNAEMKRLNRELVLIEREFGLTPASRTRIRQEMDAGAKGDVHELKRRFSLVPPRARPA